MLMTPEDAIDIIIVGTGPAGSTAAIYAQRLGLKTLVFGDTPGGNLYMVERLNNFPGFAGGIGGTEFGLKLFQQAQTEGARFAMKRLSSIEKPNGRFQAKDSDGQDYSAPAVIAAGGRFPKDALDQDHRLKGINFCSVCDGPLYRNQKATLAVVGSDNAAAQHALTLSNIAETVYLIHRSRKAKMDAVHSGLLAGRENIQILSETEVLKYIGLDAVEAVEVRSEAKEHREIPIDGLFLAVGWRPNTDMISLPIDTTSQGYIKTDARLMSSVPGLFAAGDVRDTDLPQVLTACADGARAAKHAAGYLAETRNSG
jgi:thioredoxin reductase (NADPH)